MDQRILRAIRDPYYAGGAILNRLAPYIHNDEKYVRWSYFLATHQRLNLDTPETFNEKLQWLKLHDQRPEYTVMVDKYAVKEHIANFLGNEYVFETLGVWNDFDDIDFSQLPDQFVLKCTHDSGGLIICRDKEKLDVSAARKRIRHCMKKNYYYASREYPYKDVPHRIIAEPLMVDESGVELKDYKIFCFNGTPKMIEVDFGRFSEHQRNIYDTNWVLMDLEIKYPRNPSHEIDRPEHLDEMLEMAGKLSQGIPHVRVDLYYINGKIYFGELTFFHGSGYEPFKPKKWNRTVGEWLNLPI